MTKLFSDPCKIINSQLYRFVAPRMKTINDLDADTIGTCTKGEFQFLGIPDRFLKRTSEDKCYNFPITNSPMSMHVIKVNGKSTLKRHFGSKSIIAYFYSKFNHLCFS